MFVVTGPGPDTIMGTADDVLGAEVPFYQIGAEQGFLPKVVMITKGFATPLPGNGTIPTPVAGPSTDQGLLMGNAERADVIVDFGGMANGTRIRIFNTGPDEPFGGFPVGLPADPGTTGQVMDFIVNTALPAQPTDTSSTAPQNLVLPAADNLGDATKTRQLSLNEMMSDQVCVEINGVTGAIVGTLFSTTPGDQNFQANCAAAVVAPGNVAEPMGPRQAQLGLVTTSGGNLVAVPKMWREAITETPSLNSTEEWEMYNATADAHPIHLHLVAFQVIEREDLDAAALALGNFVPTGITYPPLPTELGYKDTVIAYPGQITRIKAKFDIAGLYVWHCHIVEHEDNEMMRPFKVYDDRLYANYTGYGLWQWKDGDAWSQLSGFNPVKMVASGSFLYSDFGAAGLWQWNGTAWSQVNSVSPTNMVASGTFLYGDFGAAGLWQWNGTAWSLLNGVVPANMVASGSVLYGDFGAVGLWKWDGTAWSQLSGVVPANMVASGSVLYGDFGAVGLWQWDDMAMAWNQANEVAPTKMVALEKVLYCDFGANGLWEWDSMAMTWNQINAVSPTTMKTSGSLLYGDFGLVGLWQWDGITWSQVTAVPPTSMITSGTLLYGDFGAGGLRQWDGSAWNQLVPISPASMVTNF